MSSIVLVHGAFRGGWCWREVVPLLAAAGHDVHAPTLTGCAPGLAAADRPQVSLRTWADDVLDLLNASDLTDVVLVGHSQGGVVALATAGVDASRIGRLVLLDAPVPAYGQSAADVLPAELRAAWGPPPPLEAWLDPRPVGGPEWEGREELATWVNEQLAPNPARPGYEPLELLDPAAETVPRNYLFCSRTPPMFPPTVSRAALEAAGVPITVVEGAHDLPLLDPHGCAEALLAALDGRSPEPGSF
jgi:pimeloyl-ACP methyl ester carboxylesterase